MKILDRLPYFPEHRTIMVRHEPVRIRPYQIVVWVSVNFARLREWDSRTPAFPAILDPGNNFNFSIHPGTVPSLPLLGLRALSENQLQTLIDGQHREVSAQTPGWISNLLRILRLPPY